MRAPLYSSNANELFEPDVIENPQTLYARLRTETPIARVDETGVHLVATWDLIEEALARESDFSANLTGVLMRTPSGDPSIFPLPESIGEDPAHVIATADEPMHSLHRGLVQPRFSSAFVSRLEEPVRRWARDAIREWLGGGAGDFVPVAELVPARVVGSLLGLPEGDVSRFRTWAMIGGSILAGNLDASGLGLLAAEAMKMADYLGEHLDRAAEELPCDADAPLMHALARGVADGRIGRGAAIGIATVMFSAGGESTAALIGSMVRRLAEDPETTHVLRERRELIPSFVEEVARLEPPFNFHYRVVKRDCELGGFELHPGDRLMLLWASANRDPAHVDDPDALRLDRKHGKNHLTFGRGSHFCIGAPIARMEARIVCAELLDATASIALSPGQKPVYANSIMSRRLEHLFIEARVRRPLRRKPEPSSPPGGRWSLRHSLPDGRWLLPMARRLRSLAVHAFPSASRWRSRVGERRLHVSSACRDLVRAGGDAGVHHSFDRAAISLVRNDLRRRLRNGCWQISFAARVRRRTRQLDGSNDRRVGFAPCLRALATARCEVLRDRAAATDGRLTSRRSCRRRAPALRAGADGLAMRLVTPAAGTNFVAPRKVSLPSCRIPAQTRPFPWSQEGVAMALRETIAALELQHSEAVVVHAASRIFAALAASGQVTEANAAEQIRYCVRTAIEIALETDRVVESDDESGGTRNRLGPLG